MGDNGKIELSLTCAICLDIASYENPIETSCCHNLFCSSCIENVSPCPACRTANFEAIPAHFARRLIGSLSMNCPNEGCTEKINRSDLSKHLSTHCLYRNLKCPDRQCKGLECPRQAFVEHLMTKHQDFLMKNFEKMWNNEIITGKVVVTEQARNRPVSVNAAASSIVRENQNDNDDRIVGTMNAANRRARLGSNGKFYCSGRLDGARCLCCDGRCGPSNGCNCSSCMMLDVQKQKLPRGWLVNREGGSARFSSKTPGVFYCGRMVMRDNPTTDGYCGPDDGAQCTACLRLNEQYLDRYRRVWANRP